MGMGVHLRGTCVRWGNLRIEGNHSHTCGVDRHVVVGIVRRSIHLHQYGGTPGAHGDRNTRCSSGVRTELLKGDGYASLFGSHGLLERAGGLEIQV